MSIIVHEKFPIHHVYQPEAYAGLSDSMHESRHLVQDRQTGLVFVNRYDDVKRLLIGKDEPVSNANTLAPLTSESLLALNPTIWPAYLHLRGVPAATASANGKHHARVKRALLAQGTHNLSLNPEQMAHHFGALIEQKTARATARLGSLLMRGEVVDFEQEFARPLVSEVIASVVGFSDEDTPDVRRWSDAQTSILGRPLGFGEQFVSVRGLRDLSKACVALAVQRCDKPGLDLTTHLLQQGLSVEQTAAATMNCVAAGYSTTYGTMLNAMRRMLADPERKIWQNLENPELLPNVISELLRLDTALVGWKRRTEADITLANGTVVPKHTQLALMLGMANRDPKYFAQPHDVVLERPRGTAPELTFGIGRHLCVGRELAALELTKSLRSLQGELSSLQLVEPANGFTYDPDYLFRTLKQLPVTLA